MTDEATAVAAHDRVMAGPMSRAVLSHACLAEALAARIASRLADADLDAAALRDLARDIFLDRPELVNSAAADLLAVQDRDPACPDLLTPFLHYKGFLSLQAHRVAHVLWHAGRAHLARHLQARVSEVLAVDIHPAARFGCRVMLDHATGLVVGETASVGDDVSILQGVTLGGTGKECGQRHPQVERGVLIGAGAQILGNIRIGEGAKVGAGSVVLADVAPFTTVVGVPARQVGRHHGLPALTMEHCIAEGAVAITGD
ncbi:serine O-acetyltransferase [Roseococcus sp. XZZS9]|uniref:Serine acetyltransferase n=2 Tax=Roseococcus pinisoli TaxID=2835040 RepID=A0ABS5Q8K6_9PROT|nr:serine O-acetyltransferase [Roseococcus pinisoli]